MKRVFWQKEISRRGFLKGTLAGLFLSIFPPFNRFTKAAANPTNPLFWIKNIPNQPFYGGGNGNYHSGVEYLLHLMGNNGLKFYRSAQETALSGPSGMVEPNDVVLIKVNAQWKYRGCTNSDLIRGLVQRILDHPAGFNGEVVIFENGQGRGRLSCDNNFSGEGYPDTSVHANANDESHSFLYLVNTVFNDPRVSAFLLDPIGATFIGATDHSTNGYRIYDNVSYPCFTTAGSHRVELMEGIWNGSGYGQNLKLINVPVLKHHDTGGSEITACLKHFYGVVSMSDGQSPFRHYGGLGETCGKMMVSVRTPILNIIDATWVSYASITGYPASTTFRANQILASQDPVALDYWAAKYIMYPISKSDRHLPTFSGIDQWLTSARDIINARGGLYNPNSGIQVGLVTKNEGDMVIFSRKFSPCAVDFDVDGKEDITVYRSDWGAWYTLPSSGATPYVVGWGAPGDKPVPGDYNGDGKTDIAVYRPSNGWWIIVPSSNPSAPYLVGWGAAGDIPVPGDYDGDGKTDIAVYRPSNGWWIIVPSSNPSAPYLVGCGAAGDIPVPGDYDGDGKMDIAVYRPSTGAWIIVPSSNPSAPYLVGWGAAGDIPVPADYDGDGKMDIAVYRPSTGAWIVVPSSNPSAPYLVGWGGDPSDIPLTPTIALPY
jgi:uncharacterized protein (DUF362 family)